MNQQFGKDNENIRNILKFLGPVTVLAGIIFLIIGLGSFFSAFGSFGGMPDKFWCAFVGMPLLGVGIALCRFAFLGRVTRYVAGEVAPVARDTINYLADGTKDAVRDIASSISEGLQTGGRSGPETIIRCHELNDHDAVFCDNCGEKF